MKTHQLFLIYSMALIAPTLPNSFRFHAAKACIVIAEVSGAGTASAGLPGYAACGNGERK